jgi:hypothetical protein
MGKVKTMRVTFGIVFLSFIFCVIGFVTGGSKAQAEPISYSFTYTSNDTDEVGTIGDITTFRSKLTNTGTDADSYIVTMTKNPPTPPNWLIYFCSGGVCHPPTVTQDTVFLPPSEWDSIYVDIMPRFVCGDASVTMTVTSIKSPGLTKSITFLLYAHSQSICPVTNRWGLLILIFLLSLAGLYLIWKKSALAKASSP